MEKAKLVLYFALKSWVEALSIADDGFVSIVKASFFCEDMNLEDGLRKFLCMSVRVIYRMMTL